jgi:hypothetical protein
MRQLVVDNVPFIIIYRENSRVTALRFCASWMMHSSDRKTKGSFEKTSNLKAD